jgi:hypothetical protein
VVVLEGGVMVTAALAAMYEWSEGRAEPSAAFPGVVAMLVILPFLRLDVAAWFAGEPNLLI